MSLSQNRCLDDHLRCWMTAFLASRPEETHREAEPTELGQSVLPRVHRAAACLDLMRRVWRTVDSQVTCVNVDDTVAQVRPEAHGTPAAPTAIGRFGRFEVHSELGRGGCGAVYRAWDPVLGRLVALKVPLPHLLANREFRRRFVREARAAAGLNHPHLVPVYEAGTVGTVAYIASAYCEGQTLGQWIRDQPGPIDPVIAARLLKPLAEAVHYMHLQGVLHRDLKPGNILLTMAAHDDAPGLGVPRITDFGLAKQELSGADLTQTGQHFGTPAYMAPEQAEGRVSDIGPATDVYALGAVLYELLTGRPPHRGSSDLETLRLISETNPTSPRRARPGIPRDLEAICTKCLEREPQRRYASASDLASDLSRFLEQRPVLARPIGRFGHVQRWARRKPHFASLCSALCITVVLGIFATWRQSREARAHAAAALANSRLAHEAVRAFWERLEAQGEFDDMHFRPVRLAVLNTSIRYYEELLRREGTNPQLEADLATAQLHMGEIEAEIGSTSRAREHYLRALKASESLLLRFPYEPDYMLCQSNSLEGIGWLNLRVGQPEQALREFEQSLAIRQEMALRNPTDSRSLYLVAEGYFCVAQANRDLSRAGTACEALGKSLDLCDELVRREPDSLEYRKLQAKTSQRLGAFLLEARELTTAQSCLELARRRYESIVAEHPQDYLSQAGLAKVYRNLAHLSAHLGNLDSAIELGDQSNRDMERLLEVLPDEAEWQHDLAGGLRQQASFYETSRDAVQALATYTESAEHWVALLKEHPETQRYGQRLTTALQGSLRAWKSCPAEQQTPDKLALIVNYACALRDHAQRDSSLSAKVDRLFGRLDRISDQMTKPANSTIDGKFEGVRDELESSIP